MTYTRSKAAWAAIRRKYGLTQDEYTSLDLGYCPICLREWSKKVIPCVDHDHVTRRVRGILCAYCNHYRVGRHRDPGLVRRVADYLDREETSYVVPIRKRKRKAS